MPTDQGKRLAASLRKLNKAVENEYAANKSLASDSLMKQVDDMEDFFVDSEAESPKEDESK